MGNWELSIWPFVEANANPGAVYRSVNNPYVDEYIRWQRRNLYPGGLFGRGKVEGEHGDDQKTARLLTDFVRRGGRLGLVCDLYDRTGLPVPFFGQEAKTQAIAAMIARRVGSRIWMSRCKRIGTSSNFEIEIKELRVPRTKNIGADVRWIMVEMQKQFEAWMQRSARAMDVEQPPLELRAPARMCGSQPPILRPSAHCVCVARNPSATIEAAGVALRHLSSQSAMPLTVSADTAALASATRV